MNDIRIETPERRTLEEMDVFSWPTWEKEPSTFHWRYDQKETCYVLEGRARVEPLHGPPVEFGAGDLVTFPRGLECVWVITQPLRKHYRLD